MLITIITHQCTGYSYIKLGCQYGVCGPMFFLNDKKLVFCGQIWREVAKISSLQHVPSVFNGVSKSCTVTSFCWRAGYQSRSVWRGNSRPIWTLRDDHRLYDLVSNPNELGSNANTNAPPKLWLSRLGANEPLVLDTAVMRTIFHWSLFHIKCSWAQTSRLPRLLAHEAVYENEDQFHVAVCRLLSLWSDWSLCTSCIAVRLASRRNFGEKILSRCCDSFFPSLPLCYIHSNSHHS